MRGLPSLTFMCSKPGRFARPPFMNTVYDCVNSSSESITDFDPKPSISNWFLSSKRKRHFVSASSGGHSVVAKAAKPTVASSGASVEIQDEDE